MDFFVVPTAGLKVLFVLVILGHGRRRVLHANVTDHPTAEWTAQQLLEAFLFDTAPRYLVRDRDAIYGEKVRRHLLAMHVEDIVTAPASPWQNAYVERLIGSIRRELLDHVVVLNERHLRRLQYLSRLLQPVAHASFARRGRPIRVPLFERNRRQLLNRLPFTGFIATIRPRLREFSGRTAPSAVLLRVR